MIAFAPENAFVFSLFELLLSGLIFLVALTVLLRWRDEQPRRTLYCLALAFFLYAGHLLFRTAQLFSQMSPERWGEAGTSLAFFICVLETMALAVLAFVYLPQLLQADWLRRVVAGLGLAVLLAILIYFELGHRAAGPEGESWQCHALHVFLLASWLALYIRTRPAPSWFTASPLALLLLSEIAGGLGLLEPSSHGFVYLWNAEHVLKLTSLLLFALVLERKSRNLYVQVFLRINLISIVVASLLIFTMIGTERRQYRLFAETNAQDFVEFLRGHILYFYEQGQPAAQILSSPQITRRIVTEFGHMPDLRRVRLFVGDLGMEMSIDDRGIISERFGPAEGDWQKPTAVPVSWQRIATLIELPIYSEERLVGRVEIDESLRTISSRIARQMRIIFFVFTGLVFVSGLLVGLTVRNANRTIERQHAELTRANEQLVHAAKLASVGEFADGIAHEINNPAGVILGRADYLASRAEDASLPTDFREDIEAIRRQAHRISEIVRSLLIFSRPSVLSMASTDLNAAVKRTLDLVGPKLYARHIELQCSYGNPLPRIRGDPDRLEQIFINIINNAMDSMPNGGQLRLETGLGTKNHVYVQFTDTGVGIPEENLPRIFDPFFTSKRPEKGTGLGLSVSYGIVRDHGGTIEVESQLGRGSTFTVRLPLGEQPDAEL